MDFKRHFFYFVARMGLNVASGEWTTAMFRLNELNRCIQGANGNYDQPAE